MRSSATFFKKVASRMEIRRRREKSQRPGAMKPWRASNRAVLTDGHVVMEARRPDESAPGDVPPPPPLDTPLDFGAHFAAMRRQTTGATDDAAVGGDAVGAAVEEAVGGDAFVVGRDGDASDAIEPTGPPMAVGESLAVAPVGGRTYNAPQGVPVSLAKFLRTPEETARNVVLPKHLNALYHRIVDEGAKLERLKRPMDFAEGDSVTGEPPTPQKQYAKFSESMRYGVLMQDFENDAFAVENRLAVAGKAFERSFTRWEALNVLDNSPEAEMEEVRRTKSSILLRSSAEFRIPLLKRDPCPGCGATFQSDDEKTFGYVQKGAIERYIIRHQEAMKRRDEYADRMSELQLHWEKNGRKVGEEWLDFMSQDEFNAIHRYQLRPLQCHRCTLLQRPGLHGRRQVLSAPDFSSELRALREAKGLVVLVVDVTDFPGSMVYDLPALISMNNPVLIVLNKMDCIHQRRFGYRGRDRSIERRMLTEKFLKRWATSIAVHYRLPRHIIADVIPVSAKRGWNVEKLVERIEALTNANLRYQTKPKNTYFVGTSNVGKSSLINAISHILYQPTPPHPLSKKIYTLNRSEDGTESVRWRWYTPPNVHRSEMITLPSRRSKEASQIVTTSTLPGTTVAACAIPVLSGKKTSAFFIDTPGIHPSWMATSPLTMAQMRRSLMRQYRGAQCFLLQPQGTFFFGGVAAIDHLRGDASGLLLLVYSSIHTTHAICPTEEADAFWTNQLGKRIGPPMSMEELNGATLSARHVYTFEMYERHRLRPKADLYVAGMGWVSLFSYHPSDVVLRVRTLPGVVHGVREPLRWKDLVPFGKWPRFFLRNIVKRGKPSMDTVVRLTNAPPNPEAPPLHDVPRVGVPKDRVGDSDPLAWAEEELQRAGKLPKGEVSDS